MCRLSGVRGRSGTDRSRPHRDVPGTVPLRGVTEQVQRNVGRPASAAANHVEIFFRVSYFKSGKPWAGFRFRLEIWSLLIVYYCDIVGLQDKTHLQRVLNQWYGSVKQCWRLVYRASTDGFSAESFHRHCDGISPTYVLVLVMHINWNIIINTSQSALFFNPREIKLFGLVLLEM